MTNAFNKNPTEYIKFQGTTYERLSLSDAIDSTNLYTPNSPIRRIVYQQPTEDQLRAIKETEEIIGKYYKEIAYDLFRFATRFPIGVYISCIPNKDYKTMEARRKYWLSKVF